MSTRLYRRLCSGRLPRRTLFPILFLAICSAPSLHAQTLRIAAASDLQFVLPELAAHYEKQTGAHVALSFGSSGNFFAQIQNGAPFDLFFSADLAYPQKLAELHFADPASLHVYAVGRLVLWLPPDSPLNPADGLKTLLDPRIQKIAIANPEHAPYGRAAVAALKRAGLYGQLEPKLVLGENISQAAQFVQSGSAQAGLLAYSLVSAPAMQAGKRWEIPSREYPVVEQAVVVLTTSPDKPTARAFIAFLNNPEARATFERFGFLLPSPPASEKHAP
ncbi:MAG TPA: molybdate ABC transporter substrate-binding protein [Candidatus Eisenbacteria bacterium]|nr:molybdate ABC transporter substrate-binding protein [Candidatus Eisenbacteria bacterium]